MNKLKFLNDNIKLTKGVSNGIGTCHEWIDFNVFNRESKVYQYKGLGLFGYDSIIGIKYRENKLSKSDIKRIINDIKNIDKVENIWDVI